MHKKDGRVDVEVLLVSDLDLVFLDRVDKCAISRCLWLARVRLACVPVRALQGASAIICYQELWRSEL